MSYKTLSECADSIINEAKEFYSYLKNTNFKHLGKSYKIYKIERYSDDKIIITTWDDKMFNLVTLIDAGVDFEQRVVKKRVAWNKGNKSMSKAEYQKIVKDAAENGGASNAYDLSQSMILDPNIYDRLIKDEGRWPLSKLRQRLQWDIESYA